MNKTLAIVAATLVGVAIAVPVAMNRHARPAGPVQPAPMNDKRILVKGWSDAELRKIVNDFARLYSVPAAYAVQPLPASPQMLRVTFPNDIEPALFCFLVNYINYPPGLDPVSRNIDVLGKSTLNAKFEGFDPDLAGKQALIYVPADDDSFDRVYVHVPRVGTWSNTFSEPAWKRVDDERFPLRAGKLIDAG